LFYRKAVVVRERTLKIGARIVSVPGTVGDVIGKHVVFETESIDRMYLNVYQPRLQHGGGAASFFRFHRGEAFATARTMSRMTHKFLGDIFRFADHNDIPVVPFEKGVRKDDIALARYADFQAEEGVVFIGKAQEKATVHRTVTRRHPESGRTYPWLTRSTAMVNHYYFYCIDKDFGPFFIKFCSYFPYTARLCINGHEYLKRKLAQQGIDFEALDNGILSCHNPKRLQAICDGLSPAKIDRFLRKWLKRLPHPFTAKDRKARYLYEVSILQAEFALTQVLDRPVSGRVFFEEVIRQNLDVGRPDKVQLVFNRRIQRNTPGRFRTRVITQGVTPSLHIDYKNTRIKQYHKEGRALRTETTINNTRDFDIGRRLHNLPALRAVGFQANRRLLDVQRMSHDPAIGQDVFRDLTSPMEVDGQRVSAMRFGDPTLLALFLSLLIFRLLPKGFSNRDLRAHFALLLGKRPDQVSPGQMTYQLRRLRLRGFIRRIPRTHRYDVTNCGMRTALFYAASASAILRPLADATSPQSQTPPETLPKILRKLDKLLAQFPELQQAS
jgi:hypothetical protein